MIAFGGSWLAGGCFSPRYDNGQLRCAAAPHPCPDGFHCASDGTCWQDGHDPVADLGPASDVPLSYVPAPVWISGGGGTLRQPGAAQIDFTISGEFVTGTAHTPANSSNIAFGYFSSITP